MKQTILATAMAGLPIPGTALPPSRTFDTDALFQAIDSMQVERFLDALTPDASFTFGNHPGVTGHAAIGACIRQFFNCIAGMEHEIEDVWRAGDVVLVRQKVVYTRLDQQRVAVPCMSTMRLHGGLISEYRIFIDVGPVFA